MPSTAEAPAAAAADVLRPRPFRVVSNTRETRDVVTLELEPPRGEAPFVFSPGQFNMLWAPGIGESAISMSGPPGAVKRVVHTIRTVGPVTNALGASRRGDTVGVRGPFGVPWPMEEARGRDLVLVAGGIGLAPLRPAMYDALERRTEFGRVVLLYGTRSPEDLLYEKELEAWRGRFDAEVEVAVDRAAPGWLGRVGVVTGLLSRAPFDPEGAVALVCGPEVMIGYACLELERLGVARERIWVSLERSMNCGCGLCGHCQLGPVFVCKDGPVFRWDAASPLLAVREL